MERHVGFLPEYEDTPDREGKLRRRDTPHHLKNKRIMSKDSSEETVREILARAAADAHASSLQNQVVRCVDVAFVFLFPIFTLK